MKNFIQHLRENQERAYARVYAKSQKKRHDFERAKLEKQVSYIQDTCNVGLQHDDVKAKLDQLLVALFYFANTLRIRGELSDSNLSTILSGILSSEEINKELKKFPQREKELSFTEDKEK
jgi:hypothetical protein